MIKNNWDIFFEESIRTIFSEHKTIIDIGGGLRIVKEKNNRYDPTRAWILPLLNNIDYKVMDPIPDYHPDIIGDIHNLPFPDNSIDAIICIAVLEHVENPFKAIDEIYRVLKPGGHCFLYVPFLYYYHAEVGYYKDYWRFSEDAIRQLCCEFQKIDICAVRGAIQTLVRLSPLNKWSFFEYTATILDRLFKKNKSKQTSGYNVLLKK